MRDAGLEVASIRPETWSAIAPDRTPVLKPIVIGSHIDSVPERRQLRRDVGSLGAIGWRTFSTSAAAYAHPLQLIIFENEEGVMLAVPHRAGGGCGATQLDFQSGKIVSDGIKFLGGDPNRSQIETAPGSSPPILNCTLNRGSTGSNSTFRSA